MSSRLEIELTSSRPDGTWTWRKAGAKLPKGEVSGDLVPSGVSVGDVVKAEAEVLTDGVVILSITPPKGRREARYQTLEIIGSRRDDEPLVTQTLASKGRGRSRRRDGEGRGRREDGEGRERRPRGERPRRPAPEPRPKPKRLRPGRTHRNAVLEELAPEQRPIAEQVLRGGVPAVRQAVEQQNEKNRAAGLPEIHGDELVALAEGLLPKLRAAEWRDRAESALKLLDELDLRDLRSVVVAADQGARDDESRSLAQQLRDGLARRVEEEHAAWLKELAETLGAGRIVRALRLSSRPPKAGAPIPGDLIEKMTSLAAEAMTLEASQDRWAMVIDALAYSPIRGQVTPAQVPAEPGEALLAAVTKVASRVPQIATLFGIDPASAPKRKRSKAKPKTDGTDKPAAAAEQSAKEPAGETPAAEAPAAEVNEEQFDEAPAEAPGADGTPKEQLADEPVAEAEQPAEQSEQPVEDPVTDAQDPDASPEQSSEA